MLSRKYEFILFSFLTSLFMSFLVSGISLLSTLGFISGFFFLWLSAWLKAFAVAFPSVMLVIPFVRRLVAKLIKVST